LNFHAWERELLKQQLLEMAAMGLVPACSDLLFLKRLQLMESLYE
jgi:hypothetical protein